VSDEMKESDEVKICPSCGQPTNRYNIAEEIWDAEPPHIILKRIEKKRDENAKGSV
jgi:hypothetical protein